MNKYETFAIKKKKNFGEKVLTKIFLFKSIFFVYFTKSKKKIEINNYKINNRLVTKKKNKQKSI